MFNVRDFGALGDGTTDDSGAIQAAMDAAKVRGGGSVLFPHPPAGSYQLTTGLILDYPSDVSAGVGLVAESPSTFLRTVLPIDLLTLRCSHATAGNLRRVAVRGLGFNANHVDARGLVTVNAAYCSFDGLDFIGSGSAMVLGSASDDRNHSNQLSDIRITQTKDGLLINGQGNIVTNLVINEGLAGGAFALKITGGQNQVIGFTARGAGGVGGNATVEVTSGGAETVLANGRIFDSYAAGLYVAGLRFISATGIHITNSQLEGLKLGGTAQGQFDVSLAHSSLVAADAYDQISLIYSATDNHIRARFVGTEARYDFNEGGDTRRNVIVCGDAPNGLNVNDPGGSWKVAA